MNDIQKEQIIARMKELTEKINKANYEYYVLDNPTLSDKEWDALYYELLDLEKDSGIILPDLWQNLKKSLMKTSFTALEKLKQWMKLLSGTQEIKTFVISTKNFQ